MFYEVDFCFCPLDIFFIYWKSIHLVKNFGSYDSSPKDSLPIDKWPKMPIKKLPSKHCSAYKDNYECVTPSLHDIQHNDT